MKLNLGCNDRRIPGFVGVDICPPADVIADLTQPWPWVDSSVAEVVAYVVFEHLKAKPLSQVVKETGPLATERLINVVDQLASAIDASHAQNIIHGAVCPEHVLLYVDQLGIERCKLSEFGYATNAGDSLRIPPAHPAEHPSPAFMSPEQAQGRPILPSTDLYSLAAVIYFAWTGKPPHEVQTAADAAGIAAMANG